MGCYINPETESREEFLAREGKEFPNPVTPEPDEVLICLVNNGPLTAAALVYNDRELEAFTQPDDFRPRSWYTVKKDRLLSLHPEFNRVLTP